MTIDRIRDIRIADYDYPLPDDRIAKHPLPHRERCKLLVWRDGSLSTHRFDEVPRLLPRNAMLVYNNTRVINARLRFVKTTGAVIEIFCLEPESPRDYQLNFQSRGSCSWQCLVGNSKRWREGDLSRTVTIGGRTVTLTARAGGHRGNARVVTFTWDAPDVTFATVLEATGEIPIPPYLNRGTEPADHTDYQTVYSHIDGSVAAPTAGLHFTDDVLARCDELGIARREVTLHVGAGTFQPVKSEAIGGHEMHSEFFAVPRDLIAELRDTARPVIAVGTTSVRTLESLYYAGLLLAADPDAADLAVGQWAPYEPHENLTTREALQAVIDHLDRHRLDTLVGSTRLMIAPGFDYRLVKGMITNFHQPQSTLLLLVSALMGDRWREAYDYALANDYRFLSYGDACLLLGDSR